MARQRKKYTLEFKQEAVRLVTEEGLTYAQVAPGPRCQQVDHSGLV